MSNVTRYDKKKKWYRLKDVNLKINSGRLVAIMGVSGAGKSTLFDAILKRLKLDSGEIIIDGNELGHVPQFSVLRKGNTVQEVMEFYASKKLKGYTKQQKMQKIDTATLEQTEKCKRDGGMTVICMNGSTQTKMKKQRNICLQSRNGNR